MLRDLTQLQADATWSFADCSPKQTRYITHGYYTYPAKFIPQLAARLIRELTLEGETVADPFMGSGTTLVEALVQARRALGVDINPVARLVAKVKTTPIPPAVLQAEYARLARALESGKIKSALKSVPPNDRIDYWFPKRQKEKLGVILSQISQIPDEDCREFFLVAFSQILKSCSIWLQRSVKPTRDPDKTPAEPLATFLKQARLMLKRNREFWDAVLPPVRDNLSHYRAVACADARALPSRDGQVSLIVTSPPYVTAYEYADLHQLTALWLAYIESLPEFRRRFIGSTHTERAAIDLKSAWAEKICAALGNGKRGREVRNYFADMLECFREMRRVLKIGGKACIVIGNTELQGVAIRNAEVFVEQMESIGLTVSRIIKRAIPSKILPQTRDPNNGRFTSATASNRVLAYPVEYILIMERTD